ncbi:PucR family transcriptional regulator [Paenibacillaceae bacterium]|nr:PucR family transcriptional regulator [Paenibacillaceae bacterium]
MTIHILTFNRLLLHSSFRDARVIAKNPDSQQPIRSVYVPISNWNELPQGALILTNNLDFLQHSPDPAELVTSMMKQGAVGLCIQLSSDLPLPSSFVQAALAADFPVLVVNTQLHLSELQLHVETMLMPGNQSDHLHALSEFSHKLQQAMLKRADIPTILRILQQYASLQVIYHSIVEQSLCMPENGARASETLTQFGSLIDQQSASTRRQLRLILPDEQVVLAQPIVGLGQVLSYMGIVLPRGENTVSESYLALLLVYASKTAEQILLRKLLLDDRLSDGQSRLAQEILFGDIAHEDQILAQIGLPALGSGNYLFVSGIIVLERPERGEEHQSAKTLNQDTLLLLRSLLSTHGVYNLLLLQHNVIHLLCIREIFANAEAQWEKVKQSLRKVLELATRSNRLENTHKLRLHAGFGLMKTRLRDAAQSYREALDVLSVTRTLARDSISAFYEEMGIYQMLKSIGNTEKLIQFVQYHLGNLLAYDHRNETPLLQTLDQYLSCMGAKQETAERLFIHRQTLYHRLEKIEELLGDDYLRADRRLCLEVAIRAYDLVKGEMNVKLAGNS